MTPQTCCQGFNKLLMTAFL